MKQVTLVALYGQKRGELERLVKQCWQLIQESSLRRYFEPYHLHQIHGTIIGMERLIGYEQPFNANLWQKSGAKEVMKFDGLIEDVSTYLPLTIQVGGFDKDYRAFSSFGQSPYERTFQVQWKTNKITLMGWPHQDGDFTTRRVLWDLRHGLETRCRIKHKYENDNDFFMVLGVLRGHQMLKDEELMDLQEEATGLEERIRGDVANHGIELEVTPEQVFLAQYQQETLPLETTSVHCILNTMIDNRFIRSLYD